MGYFKTAVYGISWIASFRVITRIIAFARTILLARILSPFHFGIFGIASLVVAFLEILTETGINIILIQKKESIDEYISSAWIVSILRGLFISLLILILSGPISVFFNSPDARNILILTSLVPLIKGFINPSIVKFQKDLKFNNEFWFKFAIFLADSFCAILFSLVLKSAYGLIIGWIVGALAELVLSFIFAKPRPRLKLDKIKVKEVMGKGKWLTGAGIFQFLFRQGDDVVVGRLLGESQLGIYQVAYKISTLPITEITDVFGKVLLPVYVKITDDPVRLKRAFLKATGVITLLAFSLGAIIFVFAEPIVLVSLGEDWVGAIPILRVLSIFGVIQAISNSGFSLLLALEKNRLVVKLTSIAIFGLGISIIPLVNRFGTTGAAISALIGALITLPVMVYSTLSTINNLQKKNG